MEDDSEHSSVTDTTYRPVAGVFVFLWLAYNLVYLCEVKEDRNRRRDKLVLDAVIFNTCWALAFWSYLRAHFTQPGYANERWREFVKEYKIEPVESHSGDRPWNPGKATFSQRSSEVRPERAHYCAICRATVLRMDHHCPLIANCIGFRNHKFFLQTGIYSAIGSLFGLFSMTRELGACIGNDLADNPPPAPWYCNETTIGSYMFLVGGIALGLSLFLTFSLAATHVEFACMNLTTIEAKYCEGPNPYDQRSSIRNLAQIMGALGWDWFLPIMPRRPLGDGFSFACGEEILPTELQDREKRSSTGKSVALLDSPGSEALWYYRYVEAHAADVEAQAEALSASVC